MAKEDKQGNLHSDKNGQFVTKNHKDAAEMIARKYEKYAPVELNAKPKEFMSKNVKVDQKVSEAALKKIEQVRIDPNKDNLLPELNEEDLATMGLTENKRVLVKKFSLERNAREHGDVKPEDYDFIIGNALYAPDKIVKGKNESGTYFTFVKKLRISQRGKVLHGAVLLDVDKTKDNFEVVHWHWVRDYGVKKI